MTAAGPVRGREGEGSLAPMGADYTKDNIPSPRSTPNVHQQNVDRGPLHFHPDCASMGAALCGRCLPLPSQEQM